MRASSPGQISDPLVVVDHIEEAVARYGVRRFVFLNSEINFGRTFVHRFARELIRRRLDIRWTDSCEFHGLDADTLAQMRDAGCVALWFGLESGSERMLRYVRKGSTLDEASDVLATSDHLGIHNCVNVICGMPYERDDDVEATHAYLSTYRDIIDTAQVNVFYLQSGPFVDAPSEFGLRVLGYREKVGETVSIAFDETQGLSWADKKVQMLASYNRVASLADRAV